MKKTLVIVESPAKAKTIEKFLGRKYVVKASLGHVRDLPKSQLGIDIEGGFEPKYITIRGKGDILKELREAVKQSKEVLLATDPDREGEAISWHLAHALKMDPTTPCRVSFNEITKPAIKEAIKRKESIHQPRVDAQQARRVLDRLVGYQLSPLLWRKVKKGLSAGRVQSVAVRLICDREEEIDNFISEEYWSLHSVFSGENPEIHLQAQLQEYQGEKVNIASHSEADELIREIKKYSFNIVEVKKRQRKRNPALAFTTSTYQQEASRKLGFGARKAMMIAQQLYEGVDLGKEGRVGLITYMRTDSTRVSDLAVEVARELISNRFGTDYVSKKNNPQRSESREGAHEAIRPTYPEKTPESLKDFLSRDQLRVYRLVWDRFMASLMTPAVYDTVTINISGGPFVFRVSGSTVRFRGFMALYVEGSDDEDQDEDQILPEVGEDQWVSMNELEPVQHFTQPPPRYTEATLVKAMEENGIGRPSTYAPTIETIRVRGYVYLEEKRFYVSDLGRIVNDLLVTHFPDIMNIEFTAALENDLDHIEVGDLTWKKVVSDFYQNFQKDLEKAEVNIEEIEIEDEVSDEICDQCGRQMLIKWGRYGKFLACPGFPDCRNTKSFLKETGTECPICEGAVVERISKKGRRFFGCENYPECEFISWDKPLNEKCSICNAYLVEKNTKKRGLFYRCSNKECAYEVIPEDEQDQENGVIE